MKKVFSLFPIFVLFAFVLAACSEVALNEDGKSSVVDSENAVADCSIVVNVNKTNSRGILFINDANTKFYKISAYRILKNKLSESDFIERTFEVNGGTQVETTELKLTNLYPDLYKVSVSAYTENKTFLASDVQNVQLLPGDTKTVDFSLKEGFVESTKNIMLWQNASTRGGYYASEGSVQRYVKAFPIVDGDISFLDKTIINPGSNDLIYDISNYDFIDSWSASDPFSGTKFIEDMNGILYTVDSGWWYDGEEDVNCFYLYAKYSSTSDWVKVCKIEGEVGGATLNEKLFLSYDFSKNSLYLVGMCEVDGNKDICLAEIDLYKVSDNIVDASGDSVYLYEIGCIESSYNTNFRITAFSVSGSDAYLGFVTETSVRIDEYNTNHLYSYSLGKFPFTYVSYGEYGKFIKDETKTQEVSPVTELFSASGLSGAVTDIVTYGGKTYVLVCESFNTPGTEYDAASYTGKRYTNEISNFTNSDDAENVYATFFSRGALIELKTDSLEANKILGWTSDSEKRPLQPKGSLDGLPDSYKGLAKELAGCDLYAPTTATAKNNKFWGPRKIVAVRPKELYIVDNGYNIRLADWRGAENGGETGQLFNEGTGETYTSKFTTGNMFVHDRIVKVDIEKFVFSDKYEETSVKFDAFINASSLETKEYFNELYNTFYVNKSSYISASKTFALTCGTASWYSENFELLSVPTQNEEDAE